MFAEDKHEDKRLIEITFTKKSLIAGATMWWKNAFRGGQEIDLTTIQGRDQRHVMQSTLWQDAHAMFTERVKEMTPINVDCDRDPTVATDES